MYTGYKWHHILKIKIFKRRKVIPQSYRLPDIYRMTVQNDPQTSDLKNHHHLKVYLRSWTAKMKPINSLNFKIALLQQLKVPLESEHQAEHSDMLEKTQPQLWEIESVGKPSPLPRLYQSILQYVSIAVNIKQEPRWAHEGKLLFHLYLF